MKKICYYHSKDMDGYFSGAIVKKAIPDAEKSKIHHEDLWLKFYKL